MEATERFWFLGMGLPARLTSLPSRLAFRPFQAFSRHQILPRLAGSSAGERDRRISTSKQSRKSSAEGQSLNSEQIWVSIFRCIKTPTKRVVLTLLDRSFTMSPVPPVSNMDSPYKFGLLNRKMWCLWSDFQAKRVLQGGLEGLPTKKSKKSRHTAKYVRCQHHRDAFPRIRELCHESRGRSWMRAFWEKADKRSDKPPRWVLWWIRHFYDRNPSHALAMGISWPADVSAAQWHGLTHISFGSFVEATLGTDLLCNLPAQGLGNGLNGFALLPERNMAWIHDRYFLSYDLYVMIIYQNILAQ